MAGQTTSSKALNYLSERVEDATEAVKGLIGGSGSSKYLDNTDDRISLIRSQLDSDRDDLRLEGLRTIIALISKGRDASSYFPHVLKLSSNSNLEIRKLIYIIVRRYARRQPDVALLGINSFQRDLVDRSEVIRAMALRVLSGLQLPLVANVVELAIAKCVKDSHFYVRKAAALSIVKCYQTFPELKDSLKRHLATLLSDRHPVVLSAALVSYRALCPTDWPYLHPHFRKLCHALSDMDEWGQWNAIAVLALYAKRCITKPTSDAQLDQDLQLLFSKVKDLLMSRNAAVVSASIRLLLSLAPSSYRKSLARPLVRLTQSRPDIAYFALITCLLLARHDPIILQPFASAFLLRSSLNEPSHNSILKLKILVQLSASGSDDSILEELCEQARFNSDVKVSQAAAEQIGVLATISPSTTKACAKALLNLVKDCTEQDAVVSKAVNVIQRLLRACTADEAAGVISKLAALLFSPPAKEGSAKKYKLVGKGTIKAASARATVYWLLGQYCRINVKVHKREVVNGATEKEEISHTLGEVIGGDILRRAASNLAKESSIAKLQIITLSTKLFTFLPTTFYAHVDTIKLLHAYILQLARYDEDFDVRDRGRFCKALTDRLEISIESKSANIENIGLEDEKSNGQLGGVILRRDQVQHILFEGKSATLDVPINDKDAMSTDLSLDTLAYALKGKKINGDKEDYCLVEWAKEDELPEPSVREPEIIVKFDSDAITLQQIYQIDSKISSGTASPVPQLAASSTVVPSSSRYKDLETFLDEESEEEVADGDGTDERSESSEESEAESEAEEVTDEKEDEEASGSEKSDSSSDEATAASREKSRLIPAPAEVNEWV